MSPSKTKNVLDEGLPELSLRDILLPIFRHKRLVIGVFCGVMLLAALVAWGWAARYYVSSMQVVVDQSRSDPHFIRVCDVVAAEFAGPTARGMLRLREHRLFRHNFRLDEFAAILSRQIDKTA